MRWLAPLVIFACVPHVDLIDAPCPCGDGASCCEILGVCLPDGQACPATIPSTNAPCTRDADCERGESCAAWTLDDGSLAGPIACKRACKDSPCHDGERCLFSLHDGLPASELSLERMCLSPKPPCEAWICEGCPGLSLGEVTTCQEGDELMGCVFAFHPQCGLKCSLERVGSCVGAVGPCDEFSCARCPGGEPGIVECDAGVARTCLQTIGSGDRTCEQLCIPTEVGGCP